MTIYWCSGDDETEAEIAVACVLVCDNKLPFEVVEEALEILPMVEREYGRGHLRLCDSRGEEVAERIPVGTYRY